MRYDKTFTRQFLTAFLCLIGIFVTACSPSIYGPTATPTVKPTIVPSQQVYHSTLPVADIPTLDPGLSSDTVSISVTSMIFTGLVQFDDNLKVRPQLASSWIQSTDGLTWTFTLKSNLKFSDGTPLTSQDVAYSIDRALSRPISNLSGVSLIYLGLLKDAPARTQGKVATLINDSILTPDKNTVILKLSKSTAYFLDALAYPVSYVVEKSLINKWGPNWTDHLADNGGQGGDGPFKVKSYIHDKSFTLVPNLNYYGSKPQLHEVDQSFYSSAQTNYAAYQAGQVDVTAIPLSQYAAAKQSKEFSQSPELAIEYIAMNYLTKPFDNIKIRQAFELALNKDAIVRHVWHDAFTPTCNIVPNGIYGYKRHPHCPTGATTSGNRISAQQLFNQGLREEGMTLATLPPLKISYPSGSPDFENEVTTERQMWQDVLGVAVGTQALSFASLFTAIYNSAGNAHGLQMWAIAWSADYPDPQDWLTLQFGDGQPYNALNYGNNTSSDADQQKQTQQQMDAADVMTDQTLRLQAYNQAEQQLVNDVAWLPLYQRSGFLLRKSYVIGFVPNPLATTPPDDWAGIYIAAH